MLAVHRAFLFTGIAGRRFEISNVKFEIPRSRP
jgi:hypothetical protein